MSQPRNQTICIEQFPATIAFRGVSISEMKNAIKEMKDDTGEFFLQHAVLLDAPFVIGEQIVHIINESFRSSISLKSLKRSTLTPVQKKPGTTKINEHRPIHMLPCLEKLIEKLAHKQLVEFIAVNRILKVFSS